MFLWWLRTFLSVVIFLSLDDFFDFGVGEKFFFKKKLNTSVHVSWVFLGFLGFFTHPREFWEHISNMLETFGEYVTVHFVAF